MRNWFFILILFVSACTETDSRVRQVKIGLSHSKSHSYTQALERIADEVRTETNGDINIKVYYSSRLGSEKEMQEMLTIGSLDMALTGLLNNYNPLFTVFDMPFLYRDRAHAYAVMTGSAFGELASSLEPYGITVVGFYENGFRNITNSQKPINQPEDLSGMLIRVPESPAYVAAIEAMGGLPVTLSFSELYTALLQGVVDGQENPLQNIWYGRLYEAQQHVALTRHIYNSAYLLAGTKFWNSLSQEEQEIFRKAINNSIQWQLAQMAQLDIEFEQKLKDEGIQFTYPDRTVFAKAAEPAYETIYELLGEEARVLVRKIRETGSVETGE